MSRPAVLMKDKILSCYGNVNFKSMLKITGCKKQYGYNLWNQVKPKNL